MKNINSLVIGNTSQLSYYFPEEYEKIPSRNINFEYFKDKFYDRIFFCFAEQRTFLENSRDLFFDTNVHYTYELLYFFRNKCNHIIVYGTSELWNMHNGPISIRDPYNYCHTDYISSKESMCKMIDFFRNESGYSQQAQIHIVHPFNFNSIYRKKGFLFSKVFDSIINKKKIEIGDTNFYRDLIHPKYIVQKSIETKHDIIVGSGKLLNVNEFIKELYKKNELVYEDYVTENFDCNLSNKRTLYYSLTDNYNTLLNDTLDDIKGIQNKIS